MFAFILDRWKPLQHDADCDSQKVELVSTSCRAAVMVNTDRPNWRRRGNGVFLQERWIWCGPCFGCSIVHISEVHQCVLPQVSAECVKVGKTGRPSVRRMA